MGRSENVLHGKVSPDGIHFQSIRDNNSFKAQLTPEQRDEMLAAIAAAPREEPIMLLGHGCPNGLYDLRAWDFAQRLGDLLRQGLPLEDVAKELMDPKHITSELTNYNYTRLTWRPTGKEALPEEKAWQGRRRFARGPLCAAAADW